MIIVCRDFALYHIDTMPLRQCTFLVQERFDDCQNSSMPGEFLLEITYDIASLRACFDAFLYFFGTFF